MKNKSKQATSRHAEFIKKVKQSFPPDSSSDPTARLDKMMGEFKQDLSAHPLLNKVSDDQPRRNIWKKLTVSRLSVPKMLAWGSGLAGLALFVVTVFLNQTPTWADVEKRFGVINGFSLSVYLRNHIDQRPVFAKVWIDKNGQARIHSSNNVVFIDRNSSVQAFDVEVRRKAKAFGVIFTPLKAIQRISRQGKTTLGALIETLAGENMIDTTELMISNSHVAKDLLVFDACSRDTLWWLRIWALKESKLPIRILKWHRTNGRFIDLQFTYSKAQSDRFFDPEAFAAELNNPHINRYELMNRFLQDPGQKNIQSPDS